jgi:hypothetical protein
VNCNGRSPNSENCNGTNPNNLKNKGQPANLRYEESNRGRLGAGMGSRRRSRRWQGMRSTIHLIVRFEWVRIDKIQKQSEWLISIQLFFWVYFLGCVERCHLSGGGFFGRLSIEKDGALLG